MVVRLAACRLIEQPHHPTWGPARCHEHCAIRSTSTTRSSASRCSSSQSRRANRPALDGSICHSPTARDQQTRSHPETARLPAVPQQWTLPRDRSYQERRRRSSTYKTPTGWLARRAQLLDLTIVSSVLVSPPIPPEHDARLRWLGSTPRVHAWKLWRDRLLNARSRGTRVGGSRRSAARRRVALEWSGSRPCSPCGPRGRTGCRCRGRRWWLASSGFSPCRA